MTTIANHPQRNTLRLQLRENLLLKDMRPEQWEALESLLTVGEYRKGDRLARQGDEEMLQFFILEGMVKRVVSNPEGHEMILRFAAETEMDTSFAAWRLRTPIPYSIVAVTGARTAELPMPQWVDFLERHPTVMSRFNRKHPDLAARIPKKELAAYLNLTPETLSRLKQKLGGA